MRSPRAGAPSVSGGKRRSSRPAATTLAVALFFTAVTAFTALIPAGCGGGGGGGGSDSTGGTLGGITAGGGANTGGATTTGGTNTAGSANTSGGTTGGSNTSGAVTGGTDTSTTGGGSPSPSPSPSPTPTPDPTAFPRFAIGWGARSRAIAVPSSALSGVLTVFGGAPDGSDARFVFNRAAGRPEAHEEQYQFSSPVRLGTRNVALRLFAGPDGTGGVVGRADAQVTINADGSGIGDIGVEGTVRSVEVTPGQTIPWDGRAELQVTVRDAEGNLFAVSPASARFEVVSGQSRMRIDPDQVAAGVIPGPARVVAAVDGVVSDPNGGAVYVTSNAVVKVTPKIVDPVAPGAAVKFSAVVENVADQTVSWSIREGGAGGTIFVDGNYIAPQTPGTYHVIVTSVFDFAKTDEATIVVR